MASDAGEQIIRLLTEIRDAQREERDYRKRAVDESIDLQRRAVRLQRIGLGIVFAVLAAGLGLLALARRLAP